MTTLKNIINEFSLEDQGVIETKARDITLHMAARQALNSLRGYRREIGCKQPCDAERALEAALEQPNECRWLQDGDEDSATYMASCNRRYFSVVDGTPKDNHMEHCCYCGKPLVEVPIEPEDNHE